MTALQLHKDLSRIWGSDKGWRGIFTTVNHTIIGKRFIVTALFYFAVAGILSMLIRAQLATPASAFVGPDVYNQLFTMHGSIMMFLFAIPMFEGLAMYLLPKMLGARDMAFPRLSALGWWCYFFGGAILLVALLVGAAPDGGWFMYTPLSDKVHTPGINADVWLLGVTFVEISAMCAAIEIITSILILRAPGMRLDRMPLFAWYLLVTAGMMLFAFPPLILGSILLEIERAFGWPFYSIDKGGDPLLWQHLFWLFGHPEVYIIFLPAAGAISTILPVMARTPIIGYGWIVGAILSLAFLSFGLWVHHMFTTGIPSMALAFFSAASGLVAIPTGVQIFAWLGTLWEGRPQLKLPMLYLIGFFVVFVIGGLTGVMLAMVPFDVQAHDTAFVTAHLHYVLVGGFVFPMLAAAYYWLPHIIGRLGIFRLGEAAFWMIFVGFNLTFFLMHLTGLLGMPRRVETYSWETGWAWLNLISSIGGFVMAFGFALFVIDVGLQIFLGRQASRNPWGAGTLEWSMPRGSPVYNFASLPDVRSREPLHDEPDLALSLARGEGWLGMARADRRETLAVDPVSGEARSIVILPGNSALPFVMACCLAGFFLSMLFSLYPLAPVFLVGVTVIGWMWLWKGGRTRDLGVIEAADGKTLPVHDEAPQPPAWWATTLALAASGTLLVSLLFGFSFLWTVAPAWPPQIRMEAALGELIVAAAGLVLAGLGVRMATTAVRQGAGPRARGLPLLMAMAGQALGVTALISTLILRAPPPSGHAYAAILWILFCYAIFHGALALLGLAFVFLRGRRGYISARRSAAIQSIRLWSDYGSVVTLIALGVGMISAVV